MKAGPKLLRRVAFWIVALPACGALLAQLAIWAIPGCNPNPYALGECTVGGANLAGQLLLVGLGGVYISAALAFLVALPLLVISWVIGARLRRAAQHAG
ncbi:MAG: hypothetical protein CFE46_10245 [Burkholderiales bacterium PBB6]|nr:MAG: hypothetical protein CFE46_10245 [Burkholderiales bacterium PBB6]